MSPDQESSTALTVRRGANLTEERWPDERIATVVRKIAPEGATEGDVIQFLSVCDRYELDPMIGEAWLAKTGGEIIVLTGRDTFTKVAERYDSYRGFDSGVVYEGDDFKIERHGEDVTVHHEIPTFGERGKLLGGYCVSYREGKRPIVITREWSDYQHLHSKRNWQNYGPDMIENRCIVAALRRHYPISGLYLESEFGDDDATVARNRTEETKESLREDLAELEDAEAEPIEAEVVEEEDAGGAGEETEVETTTEPGYEAPCGETFDTPQALGGHTSTCSDCREAAREAFYDRLEDYFEGETQLKAHRFLRESDRYDFPDRRAEWSAKDYSEARKLLVKLGRDGLVTQMDEWLEEEGEPTLNL